MTREDWLLDRAKKDLATSSENILNAWTQMGEITVNKNTKYYAQGSLVRIDQSDGTGLSSQPLHNNILYVSETYAVNGRDKLEIDWENMTPDDVTGMLVSVEGIATPYWIVTPIKWNGSFVADKTFIPFQEDGSEADVSVRISDKELRLCCVDLGVPFFQWHELEYTKNEIIDYCIKPALDLYFSYFPIIKEDGTAGIKVSRGQSFKIEMPKDAYWAVPYYCAGMGGSSGQTGMSPFAFYNEQMMMGGGYGIGTGGTRFGRGVTYRGKQTPGYVGMQGRWQAMRDNMAIAQDIKNYLRQEKFHIVRENGKRYVTGFSTIGGKLNIKWLCQSDDWEDIPLHDLVVLARPLAKIEILRNFGMLREMVKKDIPGNLDPSVYSSRADQLYDKIKPLLEDNSNSYKFSLMRSGGGQ